MVLNTIRTTFFWLVHTLCLSNRTKGMEYHSKWIIHHVGILLFLRYIRLMIIPFYFIEPVASGKAKWAIYVFCFYICMRGYHVDRVKMICQVIHSQLYGALKHLPIAHAFRLDTNLIIFFHSFFFSPLFRIVYASIQYMYRY